MASVDIQAILKDVWHDLGPSTAVSLSLVTAVAPLAILGWFSMIKAGFFFPLVMGLTAGLGWMALAHFMQKHRTKARSRKAVLVSAMATLDKDKLGKILNSDNKPIPSWVKYPEFEKVTWINNQLKEAWPYVNKATCQMVRDALTPTLEAYKVGIIKSINVTQMTLGNEGPRITGVRSYRSGEDEVTLEAEVDWTHSKDQKVVLEVKTTVVAGLSIKVSEFSVKAAVKIILKPLTEKIPGFGAILVSLSEDPLIDFELAVLGGSINAIPGIEKMIDNIIKTSVQDMLVWPSRIVIPVAEGDYTYLELRPTGYLEIVLLEAKNVPKTDAIGKTDPFVYLYVRQKQGSMKRSSSKTNEQNPVWNEVFFIEVEDLPTQTLTVRLMDDENLEKSEYIGSRQYELKQLVPNEPKDVWIDLVGDPDEPKVGQKRGSVHVYLTYKPYNSEEDAKNSPAHKAATATEKKDNDALPWELYKQHGIPEEAYSSSDEEDMYVPQGAEKKKGKVKKVVDKVLHRKHKEKPAQVDGMGAAERQVVEGGDSNAIAGKVKTAEETGGGGF